MILYQDDLNYLLTNQNVICQWRISDNDPSEDHYISTDDYQDDQVDILYGSSYLCVWIEISRVLIFCIVCQNLSIDIDLHIAS